VIARLAVVALAATRLTRAIQHEQIGEPIRTRIDRWLDRPLPGATVAPGVVCADDLDAFVRRQWLRDMTDCDHCFGFWIALGVVVAWRIPPARPVIEALAVAAILSAVVDHYPDWSA
jgi:hypothetical protein